MRFANRVVKPSFVADDGGKLLLAVLVDQLNQVLPSSLVSTPASSTLATIAAKHLRKLVALEHTIGGVEVGARSTSSVRLCVPSSSCVEMSFWAAPEDPRALCRAAPPSRLLTDA